MKSIRKIVISGFFWSMANQLSVTLTGLAISGVLSRLITPAEFGIIAMVTLATGFLNVIKEFGFGAALVQKRNVSDEEYSAVFWFNLLVGLGLSLLIYIIAPYIGAFFKEKQVTEVTRVLSFTFIVNSIGIIWNNKLLKKVAFKQLFYRSLISTVVSGLVAIAMALMGYGIWAIVMQIYVGLLLNGLLNYLQVKWLPRFTMKKVYIRSLLRFGLPLLADQSLNYWTRNIDNLLVGRLLGTSTLAYYNKGYNLMLLPVKQLTRSLTKVLFPSFSMIQDDKAHIAQVYLKISRVVAFVAFPLMLGLSMLAEPLILIVYGDNWRPVIPIFRVLSILGMFQALTALSGNIYLSLGSTKLMFQIGLFSRTVMILGLVVGLYYSGLMGMIYGYCIGSALGFFPELYTVGKLIGLSLRTILFNFLPYLLLSLICYALISLLFQKVALPMLLQFLLQGSLFSLSYLLLNFLVKTKAFADLKKELPWS